MSEVLYRYYERELLFMRQLAQGFARQYPAAAGALLLDATRSADPHVERLIESFAFLTARIQQKLDDDYPELTDALLTVLYPHYLAPSPSMAVVQFEIEPANAKPDGISIAKGSRLRTQKIGEAACRFRTCYPVELWPVDVTYARIQPPPFPAGFQAPAGTAAVLRLHIECQGNFRFADLSLDRLRLHLAGDAEITARLYELIFNHATRVEFRSLDSSGVRAVFETSECLSQVGFGRDDGLLPYPNHSFLGYRLLTEFFAFPAKFLFVDLGGWQRLSGVDFGSQVEIAIYLDRTSASLEREVDAATFRLGCTPVVNLFEQTAEPIQLSHTKYEYRVVPDVHLPDATEVYSIDAVSTADPRAVRRYRPFYAVRHEGAAAADDDEAYWYVSRRASLREGDHGADVFLHLVDGRFNPRAPADSVVVVHTTCTNRDLPKRLQVASDAIAFELEAAVPLKRIRCLRPPTDPLRRPLRRAAQWRLISHLALNHLSLTDSEAALDTLREILRLYDFSDADSSQQLSAVNRQLIDGLTRLETRRVVRRVGGAVSNGFCRGVEITLELDEQKYVGTGAFLFACVIERFLGLYTSINSFTQLVARAKQTSSVMRRFPARAGEVEVV